MSDAADELDAIVADACRKRNAVSQGSCPEIPALDLR
jgi:hypothetical protein